MMCFSTLKELNYISTLLFNTYQIPISFIDNNGNLQFELCHRNMSNQLYPFKTDFLEQLIQKDNYYPFPVFRSTGIEHYFSIQLPENTQLNGLIIVGPVTYSKLTEEIIYGLINDFPINIKKDEIIQYYKALPILSQFNFINMSMVFFYMLFQQQLDLVELFQKNKQLATKKIEVEKQYILIAEQRHYTMVDYDPAVEKRLFDSIQAGNKNEVIKSMQSMYSFGQNAVLSKKSHLRSRKNLAISGITLATRAAIDGGLFPEAAYTLSDLYIQNLEELNDIKAVDQLVENAFLEFTVRVEQSNSNKYSTPVYICQTYVFTHLYEDISLAQLAEKASITQSYLSALFKKEVGVTISEYIQRAMIDEAKNLMDHTSHSLIEISSMLNFHDQSHFTKIFKKLVGVTPKQYKRGLNKLIQE
jgi:AraC-like DNA-binding protein